VRCESRIQTTGHVRLFEVTATFRGGSEKGEIDSKTRVLYFNIYSIPQATWIWGRRERRKTWGKNNQSKATSQKQWEIVGLFPCCVRPCRHEKAKRRHSETGGVVENLRKGTFRVR